MTDQTPTEITPAGPAAPRVQVLAQYVRDLSFENPHAPASLTGTEAPQIELDVELGARGRDDGLFEIDLKLTITAKRADQVAFHVQLAYGGVFAIEGVAEQDLEPILLIECPRYLFPFARQIIAAATGDGGFPPFRMEPLDFAAIYAARQQQVNAQPAGNA